MRWLPLLAILAGCGHGVGIHPPPAAGCAKTTANGVRVDWCAPGRVNWSGDIPKLLRVYDETLSRHGLPPISGAARTVRIEVHPSHLGSVGPSAYRSGAYTHCTPTPTVRVGLFNDDSPLWRVALIHELFHFYEDKVLRVACTTITRAARNPRHFVLGESANRIIEEVRDQIR